MRQNSGPEKQPAEDAIRDIRRAVIVIAASPFARRHSPDRAEASAAIKTWVHKRFALKERSSVTVSEIVCRDPERTGRTRRPRFK